MKRIVFSFCISFIVGCATASWVDNAPSFSKQKWRICTKEYDGLERHLKGLCYKSHEIKNRRMRSNLRREKWRFCPFTDLECLAKHAYSGKKFKK